MKIQEIHLASRPEGTPTTENFSLIDRERPKLEDGKVLVKNLWMSVDPYMRGRMTNTKSYIAPFEVGKVMEGGAIGEVIESRNAQFPVGMKVSTMQGWRSHFASDGNDLTPIPPTPLPLQSFLGIMGMPGMTAWSGLFYIADLQPTDTVFVSAASGAVGSVACQIAKIHGCTVIGSVGSDDKADLLKKMGIDAVINYKTAGNLSKALATVSPQGIDVYFDNVGGDHLEAALNNMNDFGRITACGMISNYNDSEPQPGPNNLLKIIAQKLTMQGFIVTDHWDHYPEFIQQMGQWISEGKIKWEETVYDGLDKAPDAFLGLFEGKNTGKMLVKL